MAQYVDFVAAMEYNSRMANNAVKSNAGVAASAVGIACNTALAAAKIGVGLLSGVGAGTAGGFNNPSGCGSSVVSLVSFKVSAKPADKEHPYGHRLAEYIAAMITGFFVLFLAVELVRDSIEKLVAGEYGSTPRFVFIVLGASVVIKAGMFVFYRATAKKIDSDALRAAATDSICDCAATAAIHCDFPAPAPAAVGLVVLPLSGFPADSIAGLLVALFIVWQGLKILLEACSKLLGQAPAKETLDKIRDIALSHEGVLGLHDLRVYSYGKGVSFATAHIEMDAALPALASHTVVDAVEREVEQKLNLTLSAHLDPVDLADEDAPETEIKVRDTVESTAEGVELHDFRIIRGVATRAVFDVGVPFSCKKPNDIISDEIGEKVRALGFEPVITVDRE